MLLMTEFHIFDIGYQQGIINRVENVMQKIFIIVVFDVII